MQKGFQQLLGILYSRFYEEQSSFSEVTSSHWRKVGWHKVGRSEKKWSLKGGGFGDWMNDNLVNRLRTLGIQNAVASLRAKHGCPVDLWLLGVAVAKSQKRIFSHDCARQVLSLAKVVSSISALDPKSPLTSVGIRNVCVIGDGYGYLGTLLKSFDPGVIVTSVNLGRGLLFDAYYTGLRFPDAIVDMQGPASGADFIFLPAEDYSALMRMPQDLVFNIASMQEMNPGVVQNYLNYLRRPGGARVIFYCCNRAQKTLPDGQVICFSDYGWDDEDTIVFDEPCPWYQTFPVGLIPKWLPFDGIVVHRLVHLKGTSSV